ncbi:MAG: DUF2490 domain-containing protein [Deltaproteobacteria bacterium]|jgi:hypothetical protein|nr:DUF2490 domain-containing protein [Deltaproteobacteria bacterium]
MNSIRASQPARAALPILAFLLLLAGAARADDRNEGAIWLVNQAAVPLDDRFAFHAMLQNRWVNDVESYERTVVRPWISFGWTDQVELAVGYDRHEFNDAPNDENRAWQRIAYRYDFGAPALFTHFWLEERFFESSTTVAWRGRFQVGGSLELPHDFGLILRNEFLIDFNGTSRVRRAGLGENQLYAGFHYDITRWLRFDLGYLLQYRDQKDQPDLFDHTLSTGFSVRTPSLFGRD